MQNDYTLPPASPASVVQNSVTGATTAKTLATYTPGATATYLIGAWAAITAVATDVLQLQVTYTDETSTARTLTLFPSGVTSANLAATGVYAFSPIHIRALAGAAITLSSVLTVGAGSITYDAGGNIRLVT